MLKIFSFFYQCYFFLLLEILEVLLVLIFKIRYNSMKDFYLNFQIL